MKMTKRLLSLLVALCMLLALLPTLSFSAAAAATEVTLTFSHAASQDSSSRFLIYFNVEGTTVTNRFWNNNTVYIDGNPVSGDGVNYSNASESQIFLCLKYNVLDEGATSYSQVGTHILHIKAGTSLGNSADCVITNDLTFKISGGTVTHLTPVELAPYAMIDQVASSRYWISLYDKNGTAFDTADRYWNNNTAILDGQPITAGVNYYNGEAGADPSRLVLLLNYGVVQAGATSSSQVTAHSLTIPYGTVLGNKYCVINELDFTINGNQVTYNPPAVTLDVSDATVKMGGSYGNNVYYNLSGVWTNAAGCIINKTPYAGNITMEYVPKTEVSTLSGGGNTFGALRATGVTATCDPWGLPNSALQFFSNGNGATWSSIDKNLPINVTYDVSNHAFYVNGSSTAYTTYAQQSNYATADAAGATYFGTYWNTGSATYTVDFTRMMFYDAENNDLGIQHSTKGFSGNGLSERLAVEGAKVYVQPTVKDGYDVTGLTTAEGVTLAAVTNEGNGIWSFTMPSQAVTVSPVYEETAPEVTTTTITGLATRAAQSDQSRFYVSFDTEYTFTAFGAVPKITIIVDGAEVKVDTYWHKVTETDYNFAVIIPYSIAASGQSHTITIPAGTMLDTLELTEDYTFYTDLSNNILDYSKQITVSAGSAWDEPSANRLLALIYPSNAAILSENVNNLWNAGRVYVNGELVTTARYSPKYQNASSLTLLLPYTIFGVSSAAEIPDGTIVELRAGTGILGWEVTNTLRWEIKGGTIVEYVPPTNGTLELQDATAMMGSNYGDAIYYDLSGNFDGANWIVNALPTTGDIYMDYVINSETRTAGGVYGVTRMITTNSNYATVNGLIDFIVNGGTGTWQGTAGTPNIHFYYNATTHRRKLNNSIIWGYAVSEYAYGGGVLSTGDAGGNAGLTVAYENADAAGAQYFGVAWGGGANVIDWTKLMIYDANGNDLGVNWHDNGANASLSLMVEYGKTAYLKPNVKTDKYGTALKVIGWKATDSKGKEVAIDATETNGIWSFTVPQGLAKIEPVYQTTELTITHNGETIKVSDVEWTDAALQNAGVYAGEGEKLLGYVYNGKLYHSLLDINTASATKVSVEAMMVEFTVQEREELRTETTMAHSGIRFIGTLTNLYDGVHIIEKGFLLTTADKATAGLTLETEGALRISSEEVDFTEIASIDDTDSYSIALTSIKPSNYNLAFAARAYFVIAYEDGTTQTVYSDFDSSKHAVTVFNVASAASGQVAQSYVDGMIDVTADGVLIGDRSYTIAFDKGNYTITYNYNPTVADATFVQSLCIAGARMTTADGVIFENGKITIPSGLFAAALLSEELVPVGTMKFNAYSGPSSGWVLEQGSDGVVHEYQKTRATVQDLKDYFDAGFTVWSADSWWVGQDKDGNGKDDHLDALDLMAEYCLTFNEDPKAYKVLLHDAYLWGLMSGDDTTGGSDEFAFRTTQWQTEFVRARLQGFIDYVPVVDGVEYPELNCFGGITLRDEPHINHMSSMVEWYNYMAADTDQPITVHSVLSDGTIGEYTANALGLLAEGYQFYFSFLSPTNRQLIVDSTLTGDAALEQCTEAEYEAYVNAFIGNVNESCWEYDNVYFGFSDYPYVVNYTIRNRFGTLSTTENESYNDKVLSRAYSWAKRSDGKARLTMAIQSFAYVRQNQMDQKPSWFNGSYTTSDVCDTIESLAEVQGQIYQGMAFGVEEFNYFTYWRHYNGNRYFAEVHTQSCVSYDSTGNSVKGDLYYWVKETNSEVLKLKDLYTSFTWQDAGYYAGTTTQDLANMDDLLAGASGVLAASELASVNGSVDTVVGYFTKESGDFRSAYMVVNAHNPRDGKTDTVTLTFDDASVTDVIVYLNGAPSMMTVTNGSVTLDLPAGEGAFVVPVIG